MALFVLGDTHLSLGASKPMDIFPGWDGYLERLERNWRKLITPQDTIVLAGDISWAMRLTDTRKDFAFLQELPGQKLIMKGNHDYWWNSVTQIRQRLPENMFVLQNDAVKIENFVFAGTRGWMESATAEDKKIFAREKIRLALTLSAAKKLCTDTSILITLLHYPPVINRTHFNEFCDLMEQYQVKYCIYGHLHGVAPAESERTVHNGITYILSSCDMIGFQLREVL